MFEQHFEAHYHYNMVWGQGLKCSLRYRFLLPDPGLFTLHWQHHCVWCVPVSMFIPHTPLISKIFCLSWLSFYYMYFVKNSIFDSCYFNENSTPKFNEGKILWSFCFVGCEEGMIAVTFISQQCVSALVKLETATNCYADIALQILMLLN